MPSNLLSEIHQGSTGSAGGSPCGSHHVLLKVVIPKWTLEEYIISRANKIGEESSMRRETNIQRHEKKIGK